MGLEFLDLTFRLERDFAVALPKRSFLQEADVYRRDIRAEQVHEGIRTFLKHSSFPIPEDSWQRIQKSIAGTVGLKPEQVMRDSWLIKDLGY